MAVTCKFSKSVDEVWAVLCDPDFRVDRSIALGELSAECDIEEDGDTVKIHMVREVVRELPSVLAKIFNPKQTLEFVETWRSVKNGWEGSMEIEIKNQPVQLGIVARRRFRWSAGRLRNLFSLRLTQAR